MENIDGNQQSEVFYKYRGVKKSLSAAISFLTDNFLQIVKLSLPYALAFAAIQAALVYIASDSVLVEVLMGNEGASSISLTTLGIVLVLLVLLLFGVLCLFNGLIYRLIHIYSHDVPLMKYTLKSVWKSSFKYAWKAFKFFMIMFAIAIVASLLIAAPLLIPGEGMILMGIKVSISMILIIATIVLSLPLGISMPAVFLEKGKFIHNIIYGYKKGLKIWSKVFCMNLLVSILEFFLMFVLAMPCLAMISSHHAATLSILNGDTVNIPSTFGFWLVVIVFLTYYLFTFIIWIGPAAFSYLYASVKCDEIEEAKNLYAMNADNYYT